MGIWLYADDIILLFPSRTGLQEWGKFVKKFAKATKLKFEASSNLCIRFLSNFCKNDLNTVFGRN